MNQVVFEPWLAFNWTACFPYLMNNDDDDEAVCHIWICKQLTAP